MATSGKPLDAQTIARIRRLTSACRLSRRETARETGTSKRTVDKYAAAPAPPDDDDDDDLD